MHVRAWDEIRRPFASWFLLPLLLPPSCASDTRTHGFPDRKARWPHPQTFSLKSTQEASLEPSQVPAKVHARPGVSASPGPSVLHMPQSSPERTQAPGDKLG